jgi:hypothetical protein
VLVRGLAKAIRRSEPRLAPYQRDEFLTWLNFINPGMLSESNLALMNHSIKRMPDNGAVIEIGTFAGLSLNHLIHMMKQAGRSNLLFSVDEWHIDGERQVVHIPGSAVEFSEYRKHVIETFHRNLLLFHSDRLPHHIVTSSDRFFQLWTQKAEVADFFGRVTMLGGPISLAYIDGDHRYEQSLRDFENVDRFLLPGGFVIFDDSADGSHWGSSRTAREAASRPNYELVAKNPNYCIAKRH